MVCKPLYPQTTAPNLFNPLAELDRDILERADRLKRYAAQPNARQGYLDIENKSLLCMQTVLLDLRNGAVPSCLKQLEMMMAQLKQQDGTINGWDIQLYQTPNPTRRAFISLQIEPAL